jgi:hypothetical protein
MKALTVNIIALAMFGSTLTFAQTTPIQFDPVQHDTVQYDAAENGAGKYGAAVDIARGVAARPHYAAIDDHSDKYPAIERSARNCSGSYYPAGGYQPDKHSNTVE